MNVFAEADPSLFDQAIDTFRGCIRDDHVSTQQSMADYIEGSLNSPLWSKQREIVQAVERHRRVAVRSCHGAGKSHIAARIATAFLQQHEQSVVITTAPTQRQVDQVLWAYIRGTAASAIEPLRGKRGHPLGTKWEIAPNWYAVGFKAADTNTDAFQGYHCLSDDHEILTRRGWQTRETIQDDDEVLSVPVNGETAEWMPITARHEYDFDGDLNVHDGRFASFAVTDEHRFPTKYAPRINGWKMKPLSAMASQFMVRRLSDWQGDAFDVPEPFVKHGMTPERVAEIIGFWTGDGGTRTHSATGRTYETIFYQSKDDSGYLDQLLAGLPLHTGRDFKSLSDRNIAEWLCEYVGRYGDDRRIPDVILNSTPEILDAWLEGFWHAEGTYHNGQRRTVYNASRGLMDQVQEVLIKLGRPAAMSLNKPEGSWSTSKHGTFQSQRDCWCLSWCARPADALIKRKNMTRERYTGKVWCISTPYETFYTRRKGRVFLSGNSENILVIVDEAAGVSESVHKVIRAILTGTGARLLLIGNPTSTEGTFRAAFHENREHWHTITISAEDTPNFTAFGVTRADMETGAWVAKVGNVTMPYPGLIDPQYVADILAEEGPDSPYVLSRIWAQFPDGGEETLIPLSAVEAMENRDDLNDAGQLIAGIDVARYGGDETAIHIRQGEESLAWASWQGFSTTDSAAQIVGWLDSQGIGKDAITLRVDASGLGGGLADQLRAEGWRTTDVNVGEASSDSEQWQNLRDELWWQLGERFRDARIGCRIAWDERLKAQLSSVQYAYRNPKYTKPSIDKKGDIKKRGRKSPDRAEAMMLAFANLPRRQAKRIGKRGLRGTIVRNVVNKRA